MIHPWDFRFHGDMAGSHSVLPVVFFHSRFQHFLERHAQTKLTNAIKDAPEGVTRRDAFAHVPRDEIAYDAMLQHEMDHLRRNLGTSYGLLQFKLLREMLPLLDNAINNEPATAATRFPIVARTRPPFTDLPNPLSSLEPLASLWNTSDVHVRAAILAEARLRLSIWLEGDPRKNSAWSEFACIKLWGEEFDTRVPVIEAIRSEDASDGPDNVGVGARDLYEFSAIMRELDWHGHYGAVADRTAELIQERASEYGRVFAILEGNFPGACRSGGKSVLEGDWITEQLCLWPVELYAIVDLAFWPPIGPRGSELKPRDVVDIHPGLRFLSAITTLRGQGLQLTSIGHPSRSNRFSEVQQKVCDSLGWPMPETIAREWLRSLETNKDLWESDFGPCVPMIADLFTVRVEHPFNASVSNLDPDRLKTIRFPCWGFRESEGLVIHAVREDAEALAFVEQFLLLRVAICLLFEDDYFLATIDRQHAIEGLAVLAHELADTQERAKELLRDAIAYADSKS